MAISLVQYALTFTRTVMGNKSSAWTFYYILTNPPKIVF
jgi:hypothetical protein